jgi:hypothetical protein
VGETTALAQLRCPVGHGTLCLPIAAMRSRILGHELTQPRCVRLSHVGQILGLQFALHLRRQCPGHTFHQAGGVASSAVRLPRDGAAGVRTTTGFQGGYSIPTSRKVRIVELTCSNRYGTNFWRHLSALMRLKVALVPFASVTNSVSVSLVTVAVSDSSFPSSIWLSVSLFPSTL